MLKRRHWRDVIFFALGTFFGGWVLGLIVGLARGIGGRKG